jgi:Flp pilus assembly protein TadG
MKPATLNPATRRRWGSRAGSAMLEFALGSGILVTVFASAFQYGYFFYQYNALENAVANGAHYGALRPYNTQCSTPSTEYTTAVKNMVVYGDPTGTNTSSVIPNLATSNVSITMSPTQATCPTATWTPTTVNVKITGFTINAIFGSFTANNKPSVTYLYQGIFSPP